MSGSEQDWDTPMGRDLLAAWQMLAMPADSPVQLVAMASVSQGSHADAHHGALLLADEDRGRLAMTLLLGSLMDLPAGSSLGLADTGEAPHGAEGHMLALAGLALSRDGKRYLMPHHCAGCTDETAALVMLRLYVHDELAEQGGPIGYGAAGVDL